MNAPNEYPPAVIEMNHLGPGVDLDTQVADLLARMEVKKQQPHRHPHRHAVRDLHVTFSGRKYRSELTSNWIDEPIEY